MDKTRKIQGISSTGLKEVQFFEMGRLQTQAIESEKLKIKGSASLAPILQKSIGNATQEVLQGLFLNVQNEVVYRQDLFVGRTSSIDVSPYQIIQSAVLTNATHIIIAHNHPSGLVKPSDEDIKFSHKLKKILDYCQITLLDHFIVSSLDYFSFAEHGLMEVAKNDR